jgi:hypothetical protein
MQPIFKNIDGRQCWVSGAVIIEQTLHRVQSEYIYCNASLNGKAWNTTEQKHICKVCFPHKVGEQLKLF